MTTNINWEFISSLEGKGVKKAYVPNENSGVTLATGFDLKEKNADLLAEMGISEETTSLLSQFFGMSGADAREASQDFEISDEQVTEIDKASHDWYTKQVIATYNKHNPVKPFEELTEAQQTVLVSVGFQHGTSFTRTDGSDMNYIKQAASGDWEAALANLRNFGDEFPTRRNKEADLLEAEKKTLDKKFIPTDTTKQKYLWSELPDVSRGLFLDDAYNYSELQEHIAKDKTLSNATFVSIKENTIFSNLSDIFFAPQFLPEDGFSWDNNKEDFKATIDKYSLKGEFADELASAVNIAHLDFLGQKAERHQRNAELLSSMGWKGTALSIGAMILDPINLTGYGALSKVMKGSQFLTGLSRRQYFLRTGLVYGATEGALYSPIAANNPTMGINDVIIASALGGTLGGGISALTAKNLRNVALATQRADLEENGYKLTPKAENTVFKNVKHTNDNKKLQRDLQEIDLVDGYEIMFPALRNLPFAGLTTSRSGTLGSSKSKLVKAFGFRTLEEAIGWGKKGDKTKIGREFVSQGETTDIARDLMINEAHARVYKSGGLADAMKGYLKDKGYGGTFLSDVKGFFNFRLKAQFMRDTKRTMIALGNKEKGFTLTGDELALINNPHLFKAANAYADGFELFVQRLREAGVEGAEDLAKNTGRYYVPRKISYDSFEQLVKVIGEDGIEDLLTRAIADIQPALNRLDNPVAKAETVTIKTGLDKPKTTKISVAKARALAQTIVKMAKRNSRFGGFDIEQLVRIKDASKLREYIDDVFGNLEQTQRDDLFNGLRNNIDLLTSGRFAERIRLNENFTTEIKGHQVRLDSLFENDIDLLWHSYANEMSGWHSLARVNGIKSRNEWFKKKNELFNDIDKAYQTNDATGFRKLVNKGQAKDFVAAEEEKATIESLFNNLMGRSSELGDPSKGGNVWLRDLRRFNFIRVLNQVGVAQLPEFGIGVSQSGLGAMLQEIPLARKIFDDAQVGKMKNTVLDDMSVIGAGNGDEQLYKIAQSDDVLDRGISSLDTNTKKSMFLSKGMANAMERGTGKASGLLYIDPFNRKINMRMFVNRMAHDLIDVAKGGKSLESLSKGRLNRYRVLGLEDKELIALSKEFTEGKNVISYKNHLGRRVMQFDFVNFKDQDLVRKFAIAVNRYTKRTVQYNLIGDTSRFFSDRALGKTMGQFRQFIMTAWNKQFLHNVAMGDMATFAMFMNTTLIGGLAYVAQAHFNSIGMSPKEKKAYIQKKLGKRGEYNKIAMAAFQRAGWSSMMPPFMDYMLGQLAPEYRFNTRSSGQEMNLITGNPTYDLVSKVLQVAGSGLKSMRSDYDFSKQDLNRLMRLFPYQNLYGVNNILNYLRDNSGLPDKGKRSLY